MGSQELEVNCRALGVAVRLPVQGVTGSRLGDGGPIEVHLAQHASVREAVPDYRSFTVGVGAQVGPAGPRRADCLALMIAPLAGHAPHPRVGLLGIVGNSLS